MPNQTTDPEPSMKLLEYHMDCNKDYIVGHARIAGKLANRELTSWGEYVVACQSEGITNYSETLFNAFCKAHNITKAS